MSAGASAVASGAAGPARAPRGLAEGFLALAPLLLAYELALAAAGGGPRSSSELALFRAAALLGPHADLARRALLAGATVCALAAVLRRGRGLVPPLARQVLEGALAALALGPVLVGLMVAAAALLGPAAGAAPLAAAAPQPTGLATAGRVLGAAAYEELVFRLGLVSLCVLVARVLARFLLGEPDALRAPAVALALAAAALCFAAFHLEAFTRWLGPGGEAWSAAAFTWRALAGMLLGGLFLWRGIGVAAWAHGLFNLALYLGAGPDVFL